MAFLRYMNKTTETDPLEIEKMKSIQRASMDLANWTWSEVRIFI